MRLLIPCMKCLEEFGKPSNEFARVEFRDDGRYELKCSFGHETTTVLQQQKFEILFEIGANAILDGYYREAVSSFTSSLERFYEFGIRVFLENVSKSDDLFQRCWKKISSQSERQLGAYIFLWASSFNEVPNLLSSNQVAFRNDVVHKGKIPTREEAIKYGDAVLEVLRQQMFTIQEKLPEVVQKMVFYHLRDCQLESDKHRQVATMCSPTIVSLSVGEHSHHQQTLEEHLARLVEWRVRSNSI